MLSIEISHIKAQGKPHLVYENSTNKAVHLSKRHSTHHRQE
jgi:hypothetical protein